MVARALRSVAPLILLTLLEGSAVAYEPSRIKTFTNSIGMELVRISAGEFMMGGEEDRHQVLKTFPYCDPAWLNGDSPRHKVRITRDFFIGQHEVTLKQFLKFCERAHYRCDAETDGKSKWGYDKSRRLVESPDFRPWAPGFEIAQDHPVVYVTWNDATAFSRWLSSTEKKNYRLPTEAEWEYACRAGTTTRYFCGDQPEELVRFGNVADQDIAKIFKNPKMIAWRDGKVIDTDVPFPYLKGHDGYTWTAPVGSYLPNAFGVYDMHGNVWEWCSDWYADNYYEKSPTEDPKGPAAGTTRVARGGGFHYLPVRMRSAARNHADPAGRGYHGGFRVVCDRGEE